MEPIPITYENWKDSLEAAEYREEQIDLTIGDEE